MSIQTCIFCTLGKEPYTEEYRTWKLSQSAYALLPKESLIKGHVLVIPQRHYGRLVDIQADEVKELFLQAIQLGELLKKRTGARAYSIKVNNELYLIEKDKGHVGHIHIHVVPRFKEDDVLNQKGVALTGQEYEELKKLLG